MPCGREAAAEQSTAAVDGRGGDGAPTACTLPSSPSQQSLTPMHGGAREPGLSLWTPGASARPEPQQAPRRRPHVCNLLARPAASGHPKRPPSPTRPQQAPVSAVAVDPHGDEVGCTLATSPLSSRPESPPTQPAPRQHGTFYHCCAGRAREGEFSDVVRELGETARDVDWLRDTSHDLTDEGFVAEICEEAEAGLVAFAIIGGPCETHSPARAKVLRPLLEPEGALVGLTDDERAAVNTVNTIFENMCRFALLVHGSNGGFLFEHPACRTIRGTPFFWRAKSKRASLRHLPCIRALQQATGAVWVYAPHCFFGAGAQKWSMYLISPEALPFFGPLVSATCVHTSHAEHAFGTDAFGHRRAKGFAAYTPELSRCLAEGAVAFANSMQDGSSPPPALAPLGEIAFGPHLHPAVGQAVALAAARPLRYASFQRLRAVSPDQRWCQPMPPEADGPPPPPPADLTWYTGRTTDSEGSDDESLASAPLGWQRPRRSAHRVPEVLALRIAYWMLWLPVAADGGRRSGLLTILRWRDEASQAQSDLRAGRKAKIPEAVTVSPLLKHPYFRDRLMDARNPADCVVVRRATRHTVHAAPHTCCEAVWRLADEVGWREVDPDILAQWGGGGIESRSRAPFVTSLGFHHTGVAVGFADVDAIMVSDMAAGRLGGPYTFCPPFEPFVNLPRNVVYQRRHKEQSDGSFKEVAKARVTTNGSFSVTGGVAADGEEVDDASPNAGIPSAERTMSLPTALRHAQAAACVDAAGDGQQVRGGTYSTDRSNAFSYLMGARGDWWLMGFFWDPPRASRRQGRAGAVGAMSAEDGRRATAHRRTQEEAGAGADGWSQPDTERDGGFMCSYVCYFGGAHMPQRFGRCARMARRVSRKRQATFDGGHPLPPSAQRWQRLRKIAQASGLLPAGPEQLEPSDMQSFIDDHGGSALTDITGVPVQLQHIELDLSAMTVSGGIPAPLDSRLANHCRIDIQVALELGFDISPKTQCGDNVVSLGMRICVLADKLDCPPMKAESLRADCARFRRSIPWGVDREELERFVGRVGNLSQAFPSFLEHLHAGYAVACAGARSWRAPTVVRLVAGSHRAVKLEALFDHVAVALRDNTGIPLMHTRPSLGSETLVVSTDASREGGMSGVPTPDEQADDGVGGFAFDPSDAGHVILVSERWPPAIRQAMAASAARREARLALPPHRCPMPAAELFGLWAVAEAVQELFQRRFATVVAVGDCKPAASAVVAAKSRSSTMRPILAAFPFETQSYLGVWVPREYNTSPDTLSHPSQLKQLTDALTAAGIRWSVAHIPDLCWDVLIATAAAAGN